MEIRTKHKSGISQTLSVLQWDWLDAHHSTFSMLLNVITKLTHESVHRFVTCNCNWHTRIISVQLWALKSSDTCLFRAKEHMRTYMYTHVQMCTRITTSVGNWVKLEQDASEIPKQKNGTCPCTIGWLWSTIIKTRNVAQEPMHDKHRKHRRKIQRRQMTRNKLLRHNKLSKILVGSLEQGIVYVNI